MRLATPGVKGERKEVTVRLPTELHQRLRAIAFQLGLTDNEAIVIAVAAFVESKALHAVIREALSCNYMRRRHAQAAARKVMSQC
jgi:predicted DNA-binding protein